MYINVNKYINKYIFAMATDKWIYFDLFNIDT